MYKNRKAVSPVIATVILVAVAITISVAVAYWMGGISSQYTKFEKVEIVNAIVTSTGTPGAMTWTIKMSLKNTGTSSATITDVYLNDRPLTQSTVVYPAVPTTSAGNGAWNADLKTVPSGASANFVILVMNGGGTTMPFNSLSSGTTVNFKLHSAGGMDYLKLAELD
jgi:flagellin-like protein